MKKGLVVGILRETYLGERRAPLTPDDVSWLVERGVTVEVENNPLRIFKDELYKQRGGNIVGRFEKASVLVGIKGQAISELYKDKIYLVFSHTLKGQPENMPFLKACITNKNTLIDYEKIVDSFGRRLVYFGRYAGICGIVDSLYFFGKKLQWQGIRNPFSSLKPASGYRSLRGLKSDIVKLNDDIQREGFDKAISPLIIGITGHGNVSRGAQEILDLLCTEEVHPKDTVSFVKHQRYVHNKIYKIVFLREEKLRSKKDKFFYYEEYLKHPEYFESNLHLYLPYLNILINGSYWDNRYPRLVPESMIQRLYNKKNFRLDFIGDISCDLNGSVEITKKMTTPNVPTFTYEPRTKAIIDSYEQKGITILASHNLPNELPRDSSREFSKLIREYIYQIATNGKYDITKHITLPREIRRGVVLEAGRLTKPYRYLKEYL